jgi:FKBP-type peptidyl-prolyl cis-trans isomerase
MRTVIALATALALAPAARAEEPKAAAPAGPAKADLGATLYAIGQVVNKQLESFDLSPAEFETVLKGLKEAQAGKPKQVLDTQMQQDINKLAGERLAAKSAKTAGPYLAKAAAEKGAVKTASGLVYIPVSEGSGASPASTDKVKVHYTGKLTDGTVFDSSVQRGKPIDFPLNGVIPCWTEGVQRMKVGGKARLVCPAAIAYGDRGAGQAIPPGATLDFEVELIEIVK